MDCSKSLNETMKIAMDQVNALKFERVHRMGNFSQNSAYPRKLVAKFVYFKDREDVMRHRENLHDTDYFLHKQFPPEVAARRRAHIPALKSARRQGRRAWLSNDTLYVDGRPVSDDDAVTTAGGRAAGRSRPRASDRTANRAAAQQRVDAETDRRNGTTPQ